MEQYKIPKPVRLIELFGGIGSDIAGIKLKNRKYFIIGLMENKYASVHKK